MEFTEERLEQGRVLFAQACDFVISAAELSQLPDSPLPEVAFAGRSNVGKSSLVNALTGRKTLAKTSATPGRTRQLNFFDLGGRLMLVDMPGHGYARASRSDSRIWNRLVRDYLCGRLHLRRLCLLIDSRHGCKDSDRDLMDMLDEAGVAYQIVLTKGDKVKSTALEAIQRTVTAEIAKRAAAFPDCLVTSSVKDRGVAELRALLAGVVAD